MSWLLLVCLIFLKMLFILLNSSFVVYTSFLNETSNSCTRSIILSRVVAYPETKSLPNSSTTNPSNRSILASETNFYERAYRSSGTILRMDVVEWPWCYSWRQRMQASWFLARVHSLSRQTPVTISPRWLSLRVQQNIFI